MMKKIEKLNLHIERYSETNCNLSKTFTSGKIAFDDYILNQAIKDSNNGDGVTYIVVDISNKSKEIVAYYTISTFAVHAKDDFDFEDPNIPEDEKRTHYTPINAFMLDMFAVNKKYQDTLYNEVLVSTLVFKYIINFLHEISTGVVGAKMIVLCAVKEAIKFYTLNKFKSFDDYLTMFDKYTGDTVPMYLSLHKIKSLA